MIFAGGHYLFAPSKSVGYAAADVAQGYEEIDLVNPQLFHGARELEMKVEPAHGDYDISADGCSVIYTPDEGFCGLDTFSYDLVYDIYGDPAGQNPIGSAKTNTGTVQIQVGSWVHLTATDTYAPDKAIMAVGDTTTVTLSLQNPRSDGISTTGYWSLDFADQCMHVYDDKGNQILSGATFMATAGGVTTIPLTVKGVTGGSDSISAQWRVWDCVSMIDGNSTDLYPSWFFVQDSNFVSLNVVGLAVNGTNITEANMHHFPVQVGQKINLSVVGLPDPATAQYVWSVDGLKVKDYDPNKTTDQVTWLQPSDYTNSTISYAWYVGGNGFEANVTVNGVTPKAWFDVRKPTDEVLAEANQLTNDYGKDGINPKTDSTTHLGVLNQLEMEILSRLG